MNNALCPRKKTLNVRSTGLEWPAAGADNFLTGMPRDDDGPRVPDPGSEVWWTQATIRRAGRATNSGPAVAGTR